MSIAAAIGAVAALRLLGFGCTVIGVHIPAALAVQYLVLAAAIGFGLLAISRGMIIEPPAFITQLATALTERIARRTGATAVVR
jgi:hypothetical protein